MKAVYLKSQWLPPQQICHLSGITANTLRSYLRDYQREGLEPLKQVNFRCPESALMAHRTSLEDHFRHHPPASVKQAQAVIKEMTGIEPSPTQVRAFLKRIVQRQGVNKDKGSGLALTHAAG